MNLEKQKNMVAILPKIVAERETLTISIKDAFMAQWDRMVSLQFNEDRAVLEVADDAKGMLTYECVTNEKA